MNETAFNLVEEFQGLYGPFTVTERLLQKIWLRRDFNLSGLRTTSGSSVEVLFPGKWNRLDGPDFRNARLLIDGKEVDGDVEIHFRPRDWKLHGHDRNPAFSKVVLHVVLFGPDASQVSVLDGGLIPQVELIALLHRDLEAYAADDALETGFDARNWRALEELLLKNVAERRRLLAERARERWKHKVHFARLRIDRTGWNEGCHLTALEILGYRRNRPAMLDLATRFSLVRWAEDGVAEDEVQAAFAQRWRVCGTRPANDPRLRLVQYDRWIKARGGWPQRLLELLEAEEIIRSDWSIGDETGAFRRRFGLGRVRDLWGESVMANSVGGRRRDTLFCDGFFPLLAAADPDAENSLFAWWFHWHAGDFPDSLTKGLQTAEIVGGRDFPLANGWCQGLLGLTLDQPDSVSA